MFNGVNISFGFPARSSQKLMKGQYFVTALPSNYTGAQLGWGRGFPCPIFKIEDKVP